MTVKRQKEKTEDLGQEREKIKRHKSMKHYKGDKKTEYTASILTNFPPPVS